MLTQKKPKKTSRYTKIGKLALVFFWFFWFFLVFLNFQIGIGFFFVFFGFFWFFWHWFWPEFEIGNWFFLVFFGFFWFFLVFFGIGLGQHSKLETGFLGSVGFFWFFLVFFGIFWFFLVFKFRVRISSQKIPKKTKKNQKKPKKTKKTQKKPKKTSRYTKIGKLAWFFLVFFWFFFGFFWGEHPPNFSILSRGPIENRVMIVRLSPSNGPSNVTGKSLFSVYFSKTPIFVSGTHTQKLHRHTEMQYTVSDTTHTSSRLLPHVIQV